MMLRWGLAIPLAAVFLSVTTDLRAQSFQRIGDGLCDGKKLQQRELQECLRKAQDDSDRKMRERIQAIAGVIEKTPNLANQQKTRWKKAVDDSQGQWIRFRNAECQDLTTFEATNKQRIAEEQRICILDYNERRMGVLLQRYPTVKS
jgi:uncharacterized protein YecT (DUF1311 family)